MRKPDGIERLYIDFDSFFASAEQQMRPELRGRPVGVIPIDTPHTCVIAASREAKQQGVKTGTPVAEARRLCPGIALPAARPEKYVEIHHAILTELDRHVPVLKVWSIDEAECALIGRERTGAADLALRIKRGLRAAVGEHLTASIGLAPNGLLAKTAAEMDKPDGLVVIRSEDLPGAIAHLKIEDIPGVGPRMGARLRAAGLDTVEKLYATSAKQARALWNSVEGERFWAGLHGYAVERPETKTAAFGHGRVLAPDWRTPERALACARLLAAKAARRMRRAGFAARRLSLTLRYGRGRGWGGEAVLPAARDDRTILSALDALFARALAETGDRRPSQAAVMLHGLVPAEDRTADLFAGEASARQARWEALTDVMDRLNSRYQAAVVNLGPRAAPPGGYAGAKIAFGRVPDRADFW